MMRSDPKPKRTLVIRKEDIRKLDSLRCRYIGKEDLYDFDGHLEFEANLGCVRFGHSLSITGHIWAGEGTGIETTGGIQAGEGIIAGGSIEAGFEIDGGTGISSGGDITAGWEIRAENDIYARGSIKAGEGIVSFQQAITAGYSIVTNVGGTISAGIFSIFSPDTEQVIEAQEIVGGKVIYGKVVLTKGHLE